ncbi:MAG: YaaR family protein [Peptococcia bacterium]
MRIQNKEIKRRLDTPTGKIEKKEKVSGARPKSFEDVLQEQRPFNFQEQLDILLQQLDEIGKRLVKNFSIQDLVEYKETLKSFLQDTVSNAFAMKEEITHSRRSRPKIYQRIETINQELEDLSKLVLEQQQDPLKILEKLDSIRGLLVDLYY